MALWLAAALLALLQLDAASAAVSRTPKPGRGSIAAAKPLQPAQLSRLPAPLRLEALGVVHTQLYLRSPVPLLRVNGRGTVGGSLILHIWLRGFHAAGDNTTRLHGHVWAEDAYRYRSSNKTGDHLLSMPPELGDWRPQLRITYSLVDDVTAVVRFLEVRRLVFETLMVSAGSEGCALACFYSQSACGYRQHAASHMHVCVMGKGPCTHACGE